MPPLAASEDTWSTLPSHSPCHSSPQVRIPVRPALISPRPLPPRAARGPGRTSSLVRLWREAVRLPRQRHLRQHVPLTPPSSPPPSSPPAEGLPALQPIVRGPCPALTGRLSDPTDVYPPPPHFGASPRKAAPRCARCGRLSGRRRPRRAGRRPAPQLFALGPGGYKRLSAAALSRPMPATTGKDFEAR